jgi:tetratricopeptide (TPR) repeat protein
MLRYLIIYIFLAAFVSKGLQAQDVSRIPKLKTELASATNDSDRVDALSLLSFSYSIVNTDTALVYGERAMELSKKINYTKGIADSYNAIGWTYFRKGDYIKAEEYLKTALEKFRIIGNKAYIKVPLANLATLYSEKTEYDKSLTCLREVLKYDDELKDKKALGKDLYQVGRLYNLLRNYSTAREYFEKAYENAKSAGDEVQMSEAMMSIGNTYQFEGNQQAALKYYKDCLPYLQKLKDLYRTGLAYENMAGSYMKLKMYGEAIKNYGSAKDNYSKLNSKIDLFYACMGLSEVYTALHDSAQVRIALNEALQYASQLNDQKLKQQVMRNLADFYYNQNDYKNAYEYTDSAYAIKDSLFTLEKQNEILKLQTEFETERKEKENQLLKAQNIATAAQLQGNRILLIAALAGLLMLGVLLYLLYRNRQTKIKNIETLTVLNKQLEEQKEAIARYNALLELKALRAQMNPHFIFNCMSSIQECMLTGRINEANTYLSKLSRLLRMVLMHSDDENIALSKELEILQLYLELESIRLKGGFAYSIETDEEIIAEDLLVPALILQPFAENAIWHGLLNKETGRQLAVTINIENDLLHCIIEDNGIGREQAALLNTRRKQYVSKGMHLIEKRLEILKQQTGQPDIVLTIEDLYTNGHSAAGTRVKLNLPIITV